MKISRTLAELRWRSKSLAARSSCRRASSRKASRSFFLFIGFAIATLSGCTCGPWSWGTPCYEGATDCPGGCIPTVEFNWDTANCGGCGHVCPSGTICFSGQCTNCSPNLICQYPSEIRVCADPKTDTYFCGANGDCSGANAGTNCGPCPCANGSCAPGPGQIVCASSGCVDPKSDRNHCGASGDCTGTNAGNKCGSCACVNGSCDFSGAGVVVCAGSGCVDPESDQDHCGASGDCTGANAGTACTGDSRCHNGKCECNYQTCGTGCCPYAPCTVCINEECHVLVKCNDVCCPLGQGCDAGVCG